MLDDDGCRSEWVARAALRHGDDPDAPGGARLGGPLCAASGPKCQAGAQGSSAAIAIERPPMARVIAMMIPSWQADVSGVRDDSRMGSSALAMPQMVKPRGLTERRKHALSTVIERRAASDQSHDLDPAYSRASGQYSLRPDAPNR